MIEKVVEFEELEGFDFTIGGLSQVSSYKIKYFWGFCSYSKKYIWLSFICTIYIKNRPSGLKVMIFWKKGFSKKSQNDKKDRNLHDFLFLKNCISKTKTWIYPPMVRSDPSYWIKFSNLLILNF